MPEFLRGIEILTGVFYLVFGLDGFFKKLPMPEPSSQAKEFLAVIDRSGFILPSIKFIEILVGFCFIFSFQGHLAWCLLSPIVFNILGYHLKVNKKELLMPFFILLMHLFLFYKYYSTLRSLWI
jgi:hypothetical protein